MVTVYSTQVHILFSPGVDNVQPDHARLQSDRASAGYTAGTALYGIVKTGPAIYHAREAGTFLQLEPTTDSTE